MLGPREGATNCDTVCELANHVKPLRSREEFLILILISGSYFFSYFEFDSGLVFQIGV